MKDKRPNREERGFTLIEMMVTVGIVALFSTIVLVKHARFGEEIAMNNLAHEVGLAIREAQVYGISVREGSSAFESAYGVYFDANNPSQFVSFIDSHPAGSPDGRYNAGQGELLEAYTIGNGNKIEDICMWNGLVENCSVSEVSITFLRPDPNATFVTSPSLSSDTAVVKLRSPKGIEKQVSVNITGQISVE